MTTSHHEIVEGAVIGAPRRWLLSEALALIVGAIFGFAFTHEHWWLLAAAFLVPDVLAAGYLRSTQVGANLYNIGHAFPLPSVLVGIGVWRSDRFALALGLIWLAHIGFDRVLGYGLKYGDHFGHTHLGQIGHK